MTLDDSISLKCARSTRYTQAEVQMHRRFSLPLIAAAASIVLLARCASAQSSPAPLRVYVSNGIRAVVEELKPRCESAVGHPLTIEYGASSLLKKKIDQGEPFDAVLLTAEATDALIQEGKVTAASRIDLARAGLGVGVRSGAAKPDVQTPEAFKRMLLNAKSITYAKDGASRPLTEKVYEQLGIAAQMQPKVILQAPPRDPQTAVANGEAEVVIAPVSEILPVRGIELVGALPKELQSYIRFRGGVSAGAKDAGAGGAVVSFFSGPKSAAAYKSKGLEPAH